MFYLSVGAVASKERRVLRLPESQRWRMDRSAEVYLVLGIRLRSIGFDEHESYGVSLHLHSLNNAFAYNLHHIHTMAWTSNQKESEFRPKTVTLETSMGLLSWT